MSLTPNDVKKIAHLAKLNLSEADIALYTKQLSHILEFVAQMNQVDTTHVDLTRDEEPQQRLRSDMITETNQRDAFQKIAPCVQAGLYLVPKVIDDGQ